MTIISKTARVMLVDWFVITSVLYSAFVFVKLEPNVMAWTTADRLLFVWLSLCAVGVSWIIRND